MLNKGDNVLGTVSEFDRGRGDPPNLIGAVIQEKEGKYKMLSCIVRAGFTPHGHVPRMANLGTPNFQIINFKYAEKT